MSVKKDEKTGKWMFYGAYPKGHPKYGKQYKKRGFEKRRDALLAEEQFLDQSLNFKQYITVSQLTEEFLEYKIKRIKDSSLHDYNYLSRKISVPFKDTKINELNKNILQSFFDELDLKYSKRYVAKIYYFFSNMMKFAIKKEYISFNALTQVDLDARKNEEKKEMLFWELDEFEKFISCVDNPLFKTCFSFLYYMGCRRGEMMALKWTDINFKDNTVRIDKTYSVKIRKITSPKTENSKRIITMPKVLVDLLLAWKRRVETYQTYDPNGYVFGHGNMPLTQSTLDRAFKKYIALANEEYNNEIPVIRIHDLRHSHASFLINNMSAGFTDFDIAKRLGDSVSTLHKTYAHWFKSGDSGIVDFMNAAI